MTEYHEHFVADAFSMLLATLCGMLPTIITIQLATLKKDENHEK